MTFYVVANIKPPSIQKDDVVQDVTFKLLSAFRYNEALDVIDALISSKEAECNQGNMTEEFTDTTNKPDKTAPTIA